MTRCLTIAVLLAALTITACSNTPAHSNGAQAGSGVDVAGHRLVECERYAPTGSRIKNHVACDDGGDSHTYKVRQWQDIQKDRAH